jgi:hypothetical protein
VQKPTLTIIEGDYPTLSRQGLALGTIVAEKARSAGASVVQQLQLGSCTDLAHAKLTPTDHVVLVAHANYSGVALGPEKVTGWRDFGSLIAPANPQGLMAFTCQGGVSMVASQLFQTAPSLNVYMGCPTNLTKHQVAAAMPLLTALVHGVDEGWIRAAQGLQWLATKGGTFRFTRRELSDCPVGDVLFRSAFEVGAALAWDAVLTELSEPSTRPNTRRRRRARGASDFRFGHPPQA